MRIVVALFLAAHGIAHLVGFAVPWKLITSPDIPYRTTIFAGTLDIGDTGERVLGVLWLIAAGAFVAAGAAWFADARLAPANTTVALLLSVLLCVADWPQTRIGMVVNIAIAIGLVTATQITALLRS